MTLAGGWGAHGAPLRIAPVRRLDLVIEPGGWPEADARRGEVESHFAARAAANPSLWNGPVLLLRGHAFADGALTGAFRQTDFASFLWWRDLGWPDFGMVNAFALAALEGSDGGFVLGVMGAETSMAGRIYFPGGTPDLDDVTADGAVDLAGSALRELAEETGLSAADIAADHGFHAVFDGPRIALLRRLVFPEPAEELAARIRGFLRSEEAPELADVAVVRSEADLSERIAPFAVAYMRRRWQARAADVAELPA